MLIPDEFETVLHQPTEYISCLAGRKVDQLSIAVHSAWLSVIEGATDAER